MGDYLNALNLLGSESHALGCRDVFKGVSRELPVEFTEQWCLDNTNDIDKWLWDTSGSCVDEAKRVFAAIGPITNRTSVRRTRMMAQDCNKPFPDCTLRSIWKLANMLNTSDKANTREMDRIAMRLAEMCHLYARQIKLILDTHKAVVDAVPKELITKYIQEPRSLNPNERQQLAQQIRVEESELDETMRAYIRRADDTLWVLKDAAT